MQAEGEAMGQGLRRALLRWIRRCQPEQEGQADTRPHWVKTRRGKWHCIKVVDGETGGLFCYCGIRVYREDIVATARALPARDDGGVCKRCMAGVDCA